MLVGPNFVSANNGIFQFTAVTLLNSHPPEPGSCSGPRNLSSLNTMMASAELCRW